MSETYPLHDLFQNKNSDFCAPLTSFDWNEVEPNLIGTSSIDTTCTIWGLETGQMLGRVNVVSGHVKTQLIAHDKEVFDIAFSRAGGGRDMFASVGESGRGFGVVGDGGGRVSGDFASGWRSDQWLLASRCMHVVAGRK